MIKIKTMCAVCGDELSNRMQFPPDEVDCYILVDSCTDCGKISDLAKLFCNTKFQGEVKAAMEKYTKQDKL